MSTPRLDRQIIESFNQSIGPPEHGEGLTLEKMKKAFKLGEFREYPTIRPQRL